MAELFKNLFSREFFNGASEVFHKVLGLNKDEFLDCIYDDDWDEREFKQRVRHVSSTLKSYLSDDYEQALAQLFQIIDEVKRVGLDQSIKYPDLVFLFIPDYIEQFGLDDLSASLNAMEKLTEFSTCEFALRPFIIRYQQKVIDRMVLWAKHENVHVRRLASEGSRPRLPWGMAIPYLKKDPEPVLPILEALKNDSSEYVRKSVANNLNDISKDNPHIVIDIIKKWKGVSKETDWVVKHASRTLLKSGHQEVMELFGFGSVENIQVRNLRLESYKINVGESLVFDFELENNSPKSEKIRLEYGVYYQKKNGTLSKKVYKISEKDYSAKSVSHINRKQAFKPISTRQFHLGLHVISLIINGVELEEAEFELVE